MKRILLGIGLMMVATPYAQELDWAVNLGGTDNEDSFGITTDVSGNIYVTGQFAGTADFDPGSAIVGLVATALFDGFVAKYDSDGTLIWAKQIAGLSTVDPRSVNVDASGNVFVFGSFEGDADFDPGTSIASISSSGNRDMFLLKLDSDGEYVWAKKYGAGNWDYGYSATLDASGNVLFTGAFRETVVFDPGWGSYSLTTNGQHDIVVCKVDGGTGNTLWAVNLGGSGNDYGLSISTDASSNIYTTGYFNGTADFDPGTETNELTSNGGTDVFISKLDTDGNEVWSYSVGGTGGDYGHSIAVNSVGAVAIGGYFEETVDFDPGASVENLTTAGNADGFVCQLDTDGNYVWAGSVGGPDWDWVNAVAFNSDDELYFGGVFQNTADFDPGAASSDLSSTGGDEAFVVKLKDDGLFEWAYSIGDSGEDNLRSMVVDSNDEPIFTGYFSGTADFDPGSGMNDITSFGGKDIFLQKLSQDGDTPSVITEQNPMDILIRPNPAIDLIHLNLSYNEVRIYTMAGELLKTASNKKEIMVADLAPGVYTIQVEFNGQILRRNFFKN